MVLPAARPAHALHPSVSPRGHPVHVPLADREHCCRPITEPVFRADAPAPGLAERFAAEPELVLAALRGTGRPTSRISSRSPSSPSYAEQSQKPAYYLAAAVYAYASASSGPMGRGETRSTPAPDWRPTSITSARSGPAERLPPAEAATVVLHRSPRRCPSSARVAGNREFVVRLSHDAMHHRGEYEIRRLLNRTGSRGSAPSRGRADSGGDGTAGRGGSTRARPHQGPGHGASGSTTCGGHRRRPAPGPPRVVPGRAATTLEVAGARAARAGDHRALGLPARRRAGLGHRVRRVPLRASCRGATDQLVLCVRYRPGRVPIVLVHGTASSPARWAEMINESGTIR